MGRCSMRYGRWLVLLAIVALAGVWGALSTAANRPTQGEWPEWRGPNRDGVSYETGWITDWPEDGPKVLWKASVGIGFSSVSVAAGRVYTMGNSGGTDTIWCFDANTGAVVWKHPYPSKKGSHPGPRMTPTVDGDLVYALSRHGDLFCLDAKDGGVQWSRNVSQEFGAKQTKWKWGFACSPLVLGNLLVLDLGTVLALDKKTGRLLWQSGDDPAGYSSPVAVRFAGTTFVTSFNANGLVLLNAANGREFGRLPWKTSWLVNAATPIVSGDRLFISSGYGRGSALLQMDRRGLKVVYETKRMRNHVNNCVLWKGHLYGFDGQQGTKGSLKCIDFETGQLKWAKDGLKIGSLMVADGKIIAMLDGGVLLVAKAWPDGFEELARAEVLRGQCWTYPVLAGGRIYGRSHNGDLVCLDVSKP